MAFIQPCFVRLNYGYIRVALRRLGYKFNKPRHYSYVKGNMLLCNNGKYSIECNLYKVVLDNGLEVIDCDKNVDLFLALAALRDDSDLNQYFVLHCNLAGLDDPAMIKYKVGSLVKCNRDRWNVDVDKHGNPYPFSSRNIPAHKATVDELIKHFSHEE